MAIILSIDQGTTGSRVVVFDHGGVARGWAYAEFAQHFPRPGWVEHDADEVWRGVRDLISRALEQAGARPGDVHAVGLTNQRETAVLWDRGTGRPVGRAIVWQDRRTAEMCRGLREAGHEEAIRQATGLPIDPYFSGTKVAWMLDNIDGLRSRAERGEVCFGTIDSWLIWNLTGGRVHATDVSNASRTLLFNIHELAWDRRMLDLLRIPEAILPRVVPCAGEIGRTAADALGSQAPPLLIAGAAGDQQAALFGQACHAPGAAKNTYGTGSFVLMHTGGRPAPARALVSTVAWQIGSEPAEYALEGSIFVTGAAVQWLRDGLGIIASAAETEGLARSVESAGGVCFVPALVGLGAPHWDPYARGAIFGITRGTTRAHLVRATLESVCLQCLDVVEAMEAESGVALRTLRADGGAASNAFLMQLQADLLGVPVEVPRIRETTSLGAAYLAGLGSGFWSGRDEIARKWALDRRYEPSMDEDQRRTLHSRWRRAVERTRGWEEH